MNKRFGAILQALRKKRNLSQEAFGFEAGLHRTYISQLERGLKSPSLETLERISRVLDVSMSKILQQVEQNKRRHA